VLRRSPWLAAFQRGLGAVALGLIVAGAYTIVKVAVVDLTTTLVAVAAFAVLWRWRVHPALVILAGGAVAALAELLLR
jgi:chromate transporter